MTKTVLITGASRGIGLRFVRHYVQEGWHVIATCRNPQTASDLQQTGAQEILPLDVVNEQSIEELRKSLKPTQKIHLLINNAGILENDSFETVTKQNMMDHFEINTVAPLMLTRALLPFLHQAKSNTTTPLVVQMSSIVSSIAGNGFGGMYSYRASKAALNMVNSNLTMDLKSYGICTLLLHPGYVATDMTNPYAPLSPEESVANTTKIIKNMDMSKTGSFLNVTGERIPW